MLPSLNEKFGFPSHSWGLEIAQDHAFYDAPEVKERAKKTNDKLMNFFGISFIIV